MWYCKDTRVTVEPLFGTEKDTSVLVESLCVTVKTSGCQ